MIGARHQSLTEFTGSAWGGTALESRASIMTGVFQHLDLSSFIFFKNPFYKIYILSMHVGVGGVATEETNQGDCWGAMFLNETSGTPF